MSDKDKKKSQKTPPLPRNLRVKAHESLKSNRELQALKEDELSFSATDDTQIDNVMNTKLTAGVDKDDLLPVKPALIQDKDNYFNTDDVDSIPVTPSQDDAAVPNMPGAILRHAREMLGLSQRQIAQHLKLRVNTIADIEFDRLNQATAAPFTRRHIYNYAKLVNIDPEIVVKLYDSNVNALADVINNAQPVKKNRSYLYALASIAFIAISTGVYLITDTKDEKQNAQNQEIVIEQSADEGALDTQGVIVGEIEQNSSEVQGQISVDKNTLMAQEQAKALGSNLIQSKNSSKDKEPSDDALLTSAAPLKADTAKAKDDARDIKSTDKQEIKTAKSESGKDSADNKEQEDAPSPVLSSNLKDISDKAKLTNRQGLASMNSASIAIKAPVTLTVKDSRGKVLASGSYGKGDKVNVSGIPPLEVSVTDTKAISVSYMGGNISVPDAKQVKYKLPDR